MTTQLGSGWWISSSRRALGTLAMFALIAASGLSLRAADLAEQAHSLRKVPADAAFYSSSLRLKEQWDGFIGSKAYEKLMEIPLVQLVKMQAEFQWQQINDPHVAHVRDYLQSPAGNDAVGVLKEMFSEEVFAYGGSNITTSIKFFMEVNSVVRSTQMQAGEDKEDAQKAIAEKVIKLLKEKSSSGITVPTMVFGFRIKDKERAKRELDEVHSLIRNVLDEHQPDLGAHLQRDQIGGHEFLTFRVDGSMIPWEKLREQAENVDEEQFNAVRDVVSKQTLAIALGVVDEFVLLSVGPSTDHLEKIGQGPTLSEQAAIKRLEAHAGQKIVSLTYISKAFAESLGSPKQTADNIAQSVDQLLASAKVDEADRKPLLDDIRGFDFSKYVPEPAETSMVAFRTDRGYEAFQYTPTKQPMLDSSKPLTILNHVGGSPMVLIATRSKHDLAEYDRVVTWLKQVAGHVEAIAEKHADSDDWDKYKEVRDRGVALLERLNQANREHLLPALADGQAAFVVDDAAKSQKWFDQMPVSPKPLPMPELALVTSVSDAEKLRQGVTTYIDVARDAYKLAKEMHPDDTPKIKLPKPTISDMAGGGKLYSYAFPKKWGVDPSIAPNAGLTDKFGVVSLMPQMTERLLSDKAAGLDTSLKLDHPAAVVSHVDFAKMIDAVGPWLDYGVDIAMGKIKPPKKEGDDDEAKDDQPAEPPLNQPMLLQMGFIAPQIHQLLDAASAIRSVTSMTYEENGVWVTHSESHIEDLK